MSQQLANIHDAFFKQVLSDPKLASTFLREHLPPEVAELLGSKLPVLIPGSFVDEELRQHHSDLLYQVQLKGRREALAYVLMEQELTRSGRALATIALSGPRADHMLRAERQTAPTAYRAPIAGPPRTGRLEYLLRIYRPVWQRAGATTALPAFLSSRAGRSGADGGRGSFCRGEVAGFLEARYVGTTRARPKGANHGMVDSTVLRPR